ncbi:GIY-YIG nuclease family protein [Polaribacter sp. M15]
MPYFLYILYSKNLDKYYVGVSVNIEERLQRHLSNHKGFTSRAKDWQIVYFEKYENRLLALKREKRIKNWKSRKMIEKLIDEK